VEVVIAEDDVDTEIVGGQYGIPPGAIVGRATGLNLDGDAEGTGHECS
jgi:hypothetical protein